MNTKNGAPAAHLVTSTPWLSDVKLFRYPALAKNLQCDVCVVGGGIAGLTTAYLLSQHGKSVCLLEGLNFGEGQTAQTSAHVTAVLDERFHKIFEHHGLENTRQVIESHVEALTQIEDIVTAEDIDCDLEKINAYLCTSDTIGDREDLEKDLLAVHRAGLKGVRRLSSSPLQGFTSGPCLVFPHQMQIHPLKYISGLAAAVVRQDGQIFCRTHVISMTNEGNGVEVKTSNGFTVTATSVVVATNSPVNRLFAIHTKQTACRTYAMAFKIPKFSVPRALYWDTESPYHYLRTHHFTAIHDLFIVGGEDHKTGQNEHPEQCFDQLETWTRVRFPFTEDVVHKWSGQILNTLDGLPYIGRSSPEQKNVYVITGHSGVGMCESTMGAKLVTDLILGVKNNWEQLYTPSRFSLRTVGEYLKTNINVAKQYTDWLAPQHMSDVEELSRGEGTVINQGFKKIAVFKNRDGNLKTFSAACPHMGGVVQWNSVEKSWDCPCHGSRFNSSGKVIEGPAVENLDVANNVFTDENLRPIEPKYTLGSRPDIAEIHPGLF